MATENPFYNHETGQPIQLSRGASSAIRAEFDLVASAFTAAYAAITAANTTGDFKLIYQGALSADPLTRYNGTALQPGDLYFNSVERSMKGYAGGVWNAIPTTASVLPKSGGTMTGPLFGTSATYSGLVQAAAFAGVGTSLTGFTFAQIVAALNYTPANKAGDTFTGTVNGTNANFSGTLAGGIVMQTSDERLKKKWQKLPPDTIARLAKMKKAGAFVWKRGDRDAVGVSAQELQEILPGAVEGLGKYLYVDAGGAALALCVELAREVVKLRAELERLK